MTIKPFLHGCIAATLLALGACAAPTPPPPDYDLVIRGGTVYDGNGEPGVRADVAVKGDQIVAIGEVRGAARMEALVAQAMEEGALGVGSSLIYAPAFYSSTSELVALSRVAARYGGRYISHLRSEGAQLLEAVGQLVTIAREAGIGAEIYHLKAAGRDHWDTLEAVFQRVEAARAEGLDITANM